MDIWYKNNMGELQRLQSRLFRACRSRFVKLYVLTDSQQEEIWTKIEDAWFEGKISGFISESAPGTKEYETSFVNYVVFQILPNKTIDYFRARKNHQAENVDDMMEETVLAALGEATPDPASLHEFSQLREILRLCAAQLSDTLKQVYDLYIIDYTQQEIAEELAIKLGTVKSRTSEMVKKLAECVNPQRSNFGRP